MTWYLVGETCAICLPSTLVSFAVTWKLRPRRVHALRHPSLRNCSHLPPPRRAPQLPRCNSSTRPLLLPSFWCCSQLRRTHFYPCRWEWNSTPHPISEQRQGVSRSFWAIAISLAESPLMCKLLGARLPCQPPSLVCLVIRRWPAFPPSWAPHLTVDFLVRCRSGGRSA